MSNARYITYISDHPATGLPMLMTKERLCNHSDDQIKQLMTQAVNMGLKQVAVLSWDEINAIRAQQFAEIDKASTLIEIDFDTFDQMANNILLYNWSKSHLFESFTLPQQIRSKVFLHFLRVGAGETARYFQIEASLNASQTDLYHMYIKVYGETSAA